MGDGGGSGADVTVRPLFLLAVSCFKSSFTADVLVLRATDCCFGSSKRVITKTSCLQGGLGWVWGGVGVGWGGVGWGGVGWGGVGWGWGWGGGGVGWGGVGWGGVV